MKSTRFFKFLSHFFEKYDRKLFSHDIKNKLINLADFLTRTDSSTIAKRYFKRIIFNPKIFLKFDTSLQVNIFINID
jgi:hypothetical protein